MISKDALRVLRKAHHEVVTAPTAGQTRGAGESSNVVNRIESSTSQAAFDVYHPADDRVAAFLVVAVTFFYMSGPAFALISLVNFMPEPSETSGLFTEMGVGTIIHRGESKDLAYALIEYLEKTKTDLSITTELLSELASDSMSGSMTSIACCMILLVAAKQQTTVHAATYVNRRLSAFIQSQRGLIPEADAIFGTAPTFPGALVESISNIARTSPAICKMLLTMVQGLSESSRGDISKPAEVTLTLVSFAQATPLILATRFALSCPAIAKIEASPQGSHLWLKWVFSAQGPQDHEMTKSLLTM